MFNDIWSLGIILLNLATGCNPWKSATPVDPTFQAYLRDPFNFHPSIHPISPEINAILVRMLEVDWRKRMTLKDVRYAIERVHNFHSDGVVFEGSMACCAWEAGMEIDNTSSESTLTLDKDVGPVSPPARSTTSSGVPQEIVDAHATLHSHWSKESILEIVQAQPLAEEASYGPQWTKRSLPFWRCYMGFGHTSHFFFLGLRTGPLSNGFLQQHAFLGISWIVPAYNAEQL
jgi:serine/threonine protein kinase